VKRLLAALAIATLAAPALARREFVATAEDFRCLTDGTQPPGKRFYVFGRKAVVRKALRKTKTGRLGRKGFAVGTILQLFPFEAMAKRGGDFNPEGGGWEYFTLRPNPDGTTTILKRGGAEVTGLTQSSCQTCHLQLAAEHDSVCEFVVGPEGLGLTDELIRALQRDVRCDP
jgi:hypothetical protein